MRATRGSSSGLILKVLRESYAVPEVKKGLAICKANTILPVLSLLPYKEHTHTHTHWDLYI